MNETSLVLPGSEVSPALHVHASPLYALYHYLAREALRAPEERDPATAHASSLMELALRYRRSGGWMIWDEEVAGSSDPEEAMHRLRRALAEESDLPWDRAGMERAIEGIARALEEAEVTYLETLWAERQGLLESALRTIRETLSPRWTGMVRSQAELLGLTWPDRLDVHLVPDCYMRQGAYSHPLTVGMDHNRGLELCETLLHEATHVADVHTSAMGRESLGDRLMARLEASGVSREAAWNAWHAVIFAASARQVRSCIDPSYTDYATPRDLYSWFGVPHLPGLWEDFVSGSVDESAFLDAVAAEVGDNL